MSEKRFEVLFYGDVINCVRDENGKEYNLHELINLLMDQQAIINKLNDELELTANTKLYSRRELERKVDEQQATIRRLQDLCGESDGENAKLRIENKRLEEENRELRQSVEYWQKKYEEGTETFQID